MKPWVEAMIGKDLSTPEGYELGFDIVVGIGRNGQEG